MRETSMGVEGVEGRAALCKQTLCLAGATFSVQVKLVPIVHLYYSISMFTNNSCRLCIIYELCMYNNVDKKGKYVECRR